MSNGDIEYCHKWEHEKFVEQMESWLDFVWDNLKDLKYRTYQGERTGVPNLNFHCNSIGNIKGSKAKAGLKSAFNSWEIFKDWKAQQTIAHKSLLTYDQAVNEMNIFLDFMQDNYLDFVEY